MTVDQNLSAREMYKLKGFSLHKNGTIKGGYRKSEKIPRPSLYLELKNNSRKCAKNILCYLVKS